MSQEKLTEVALGSPLIPLLKRRLEAGYFLSLNSVADAGRPFVVSLLSQISNRPVLVVTDGPAQLKKSADHVLENVKRLNL